MKKFEILDEKGDVINRIVASDEFVEKHHPGKFKEITEPEVEVEQQITAEDKINRILVDIAEIKAKIQEKNHDSN